MKSFRQIAVLLLLSLSIGACNRASPIKFTGETQGTTYHVTVVACQPQRTLAALQQRVEQRLAEIDRALSNYRDDSELSQFNRTAVNEWINVGPDLYSVLQASQKISAASDGAFDITVAPLVDLWGFGREHKEGYIPSDTEIEQARTMVDFRQLEIDPLQARVKKHKTLRIDVNGIAQGYTVDQLALALNGLGCSDYLVEVGGELRLSGRNAEQQLWRVGIEKPVDGYGGSEQAIRATEVGVTTAGDYHDYFEKDGVRYSHTIDPHTGRPIAHKLASVTVVAADATQADGWDTALEVLGPEKALDLTQKKNIAAYFIVRDGEKFATFHSAAMNKFIE